MRLTRYLSQPILAALLILSTGTLQSAEIDISRSSECSMYLAIRGEIAAGDKNKFLTPIESKKRSLPPGCAQLNVFVWLDSAGGDVHAAIDLGYAMRDVEATVNVLPDAICSSSCVLLIAAAVQRYVQGRVGVHRPYFSALEADASTSQIKQRRDATNAKIRTFLVDMDVSTAVLDMMLMVRPEEIRYLTREELAQMRLSGKDATWDEMITARQASFYGLRSQEFRARNARAERECTISNNPDSHAIRRYVACQDAITMNISTAEAERRRRHMDDKCKQQKHSERLACRSQIMQGR